MAKLSHIVESFLLTVEHVGWEYWAKSEDDSEIYYHYTNREGLQGILRSGGFCARNRIKMNDAGEFDYARNLIYQVLDEMGKRKDLPRAAGILTRCTRNTLKKFLEDTTERSMAYCACLTPAADDIGQWETYAEAGRGFAIGFDFRRIRIAERRRAESQQPYLFWAQVIYDQYKQRDLVQRLVKAGACDFQNFENFEESHSRQREDLVALLDRVAKVIVLHLLTLSDFLKAPEYSSEREIRLALEPNDGTLKAPSIRFPKSNGESFPFIFMDLRNPITGRLPLVEIKTGPRSRFDQDLSFVERLLDDLDYGSGGFADRPRIVQSKAQDE